MTLADSIEKLHRTVDIAHFWPVDLVGVSNTDDARLRLRVSQVVAHVGDMHPSLHVYVALAGSASNTGRRTCTSAICGNHGEIQDCGSESTRFLGGPLSSI